MTLKLSVPKIILYLSPSLLDNYIKNIVSLFKDGVSFVMHKPIMAAASGYLRMLLKTNIGTHECQLEGIIMCSPFLEWQPAVKWKIKFIINQHKTIILSSDNQ